MSKSFTANTEIKFDPRLEAVEFGSASVTVKVLRATANLPTRMAAFVHHEDFHPTRTAPRTKEPILVTTIDPKKVPTFGQFATLARAAARAAGLKGGHLVQNKIYITPSWWKKAEHHQGMHFHFVTNKGLIKV
jgi:hypothetical protein